MPAKHVLPFIGRAAIIDAVITRLQHPDDLRDNPDKFISPGFYAMAGMGKSRLLNEVEQRAKRITPYIVKIDFEPRFNFVPSTPIALIRYLIDTLEEQDKTTRPVWRKIFWRWSNPFETCQKIVGNLHANVTTINQNINIISSRAGNVSQDIDLGGAIPDSLIQAFEVALTKLYAKRQIKRMFGDFGLKKQLPLVLIILDTVDLAPRPIRQWIGHLHNISGAKNTLSFHVMFVLASRLQLTGTIDTPLPVFDPSEAKAFLRAYVSFLLEHSQHQTTSLSALIDSEAAQTKLVNQAQGIPLLLQLLVNTVALEPDAAVQIENFPEQHDVLVTFVIENYLDRLREQANSQNDDRLWSHYYLLLYSAVPRWIPNVSFLRGLLEDLPGTTFDARSNYDELYRELSREGFVERVGNQELVLHNFIRDGIYSYLQTSDAEQFARLHQRAAKWFRSNTDLPNYFYHELHNHYVQAFDELKAALIAALAQQHWLEAQALIEIAAAVQLRPQERAWIDIFKGDLAWGEGNRNLALARLRELYTKVDDPALADEIATRLEKVLGFEKGLEEQLKTGTIPLIPEQYFSDLLWWADQREHLRTKAYALRVMGEKEFRLKNFDEARKLIESHLEIANQIGDDEQRAFAMALLGEITLIKGPLTAAAQYLRNSVDLYGSLGQLQELSTSKLLLAIALFSAGEIPNAKRLLNEAKAIQDEIGDISGQARTLRVVWLMTMRNAQIGEFEDALNGLHESLKFYEEIKDPLGQGHVLSLQAEALLSMGRGNSEFRDWYGAVRYAQERATSEYKQAKDPLGQAGALQILGLVEAMNKTNPTRLEFAVINLRQARSIYRAEHDRLSRAHCQVAFGAVSYILGKKHEKASAESREALEDAIRVYDELGDMKGKGGVLFVMGQVALWHLDYEKAQRYFEEALSLFTSQNYFLSSDLAERTLEFLHRVSQRIGPPDKHEEHLVFLFRARVVDLYGWSSVLRREFEGLYRLFEVEDASQNVHRLSRKYIDEYEIARLFENFARRKLQN